MYNRRTFLKNNFCCNCPCSTDEVRRGTAHLRADAPAGDIDLLLCQHALIEHSLILLFHAYRAAATAHIAGDLVDIGHMIMATLFSPTLRAAAFRSSSAATGMTNTK